MLRDLPARRFLVPLTELDSPLALPHLETDGGLFRFLGQETTRVDQRTLPLWLACDGSRKLGSWPAAERGIIEGWHAAGLVVAVSQRHAVGAEGPVVVSPHPDDAPLAVGGLLAACGGRVVDVFTQETWTRRPYYAQRPQLSASLLLDEERVACRVLDAELTLLGYVDGEARKPWADGFFLDDPAASVPCEVEPDLFAQLVADLAAALPSTGAVLTPLAVGGHVDHILSREAVLALVKEDRLDARRVVFYEDMPYSLFASALDAATALGAREDVGALRPVLVPSRTAEVKLEALWAYRLQTTEGMTARVVRYGRELTAEHAFTERLWLREGQPVPPPLPATGHRETSGV